MPMMKFDLFTVDGNKWKQATTFKKQVTIGILKDFIKHAEEEVERELKQKYDTKRTNT